MFEQDRVLVRLQQYIQRDSGIAAAFLAGSYGRGTQDSYSDLDVILVYIDEPSRALAFSSRTDFIKSVSPYLSYKSFDALHVRPFLHICLYNNGAKVDFLYETLAMEPQFHLHDMRILKDNNGWAASFLQECAARKASLSKPAASSEQLSAIDNRFWNMFMDIYRQLLRGDHDAPFVIYLRLIYFTLPELLNLLPPEDPAYQALINIRYGHDTRQTAEHMRLLLRAYLDAREAIVSRHQLAFAGDPAFERDIQRIVDR